jgi:hypothetical protein
MQTHLSDTDSDDSDFLGFDNDGGSDSGLF